LARELELPDFDASALKLAQPRALTQHVASHIYRLPTGIDDDFFAGVRFASRHGDELAMWAIFERPGDEPISSRLAVLTESPISVTDPELVAALELHGLRWPSR